MRELETDEKRSWIFYLYFYIVIYSMSISRMLGRVYMFSSQFFLLATKKYE